MPAVNSFQMVINKLLRLEIIDAKKKGRKKLQCFDLSVKLFAICFLQKVTFKNLGSLLDSWFRFSLGKLCFFCFKTHFLAIWGTGLRHLKLHGKRYNSPSYNCIIIILQQNIKLSTTLAEGYSCTWKVRLLVCICKTVSTCHICQPFTFIVKTSYQLRSVSCGCVHFRRTC